MVTAIAAEPADVRAEWVVRYRNSNRYFVRTPGSFDWVIGADNASRFPSRSAALGTAYNLGLRRVAVPMKYK